VTIPEVVEVLERTPQALSGLLSDLGEPWLAADEGEGTFSPRDVVGHLLFGEETDWMPRVRIILEHGEARAFDPFDRFGFRKYGGLSTDDLLRRFATLRRENLDQLARLALTPALLDRKGTHPELGTVTLGQLLATWAVHDLNHISQIARVMARRYETAVGPWVPYLGILNRARPQR
jgi:DinB superfamily